MLQAPSASSVFASTIEEFVRKADVFLQNHYLEGSNDADIKQMLQAIANLQLDIDAKALEKEFALHCERQDLLNDYYDSNWF